VSFPRGAVAVGLPAGHPAQALQLLDAQGAVLLEQPAPGTSASSVRFDYPWAPGEPLSLRAQLRDGTSSTLPLVAPPALPPPVSVSVQLPQGIDLPADGSLLLLPARAVETLAFTLRNVGDGPWRGTLVVNGGEALSLRVGESTAAGSRARVSAILALPGEAVTIRVRVGTGQPHQGALLSWSLQGTGLAAPLEGGWRIAVAPAAELTHGLRLAESVFPADPLGAPQSHRPADTLVLPPHLPAWLGGAARDRYGPAAHARLVVENRLPGEVAAVLRTWVEPASGGAPLEGFGNPLLPIGGAVLVALTRVPAGQTALVAQPVYFDPQRAGPGDYRRCVQILPWGTAAAGPPECRPLRVTASPLWDWAALWLATLAAAAAFAAALWRAPRWMRRFALRDHVLAALTFGLAFAASSLPFLFVSAFAAALLGPFLFLVEGFFYKGLLFLVLGSLFAVLPRPGVYLLFYSLWMVAQALLSGYYAYGPVTLLFAGVAVTCMEAALWVGGVTRHGGGRQVSLLWPALAIGLGEAAIVYWDLLLLRALYRQYFAQWYLLLEAGSAGLYAAVGAAAGLRLGRMLRDVRRPPLPEPLLSGLPAAQTAFAPPPVAGAALLEVSRLTYAYPGATSPIVRAVSLTLHPGEIVVLGGATGSGKTTLLRLIQGLLPLPDPAAVRLQGHGRDAYDAREWAARCALLFQEPALQIVQTTVAEEVALGLQLAGRPSKALAVQSALAEYGLADLAARAPAGLSGGELQRTALAALLAGSPRVLLLDEPLAHLDAAAREQLPGRLQALAATGMAVLVVEHRLQPLLPVAHRVLWLESGGVGFAGAPAAFQAWQARKVAPIRQPDDRPRTPPPALTLSAANGTLHLRDVSFQHADAHGAGLQSITATLGAGQAVALLGPNGAGKSTLLELILGLRRPAAGSVTWDGEAAHRLPWRERSRRFGYLPQRADLLLHARTAAEELGVALRWRGWASAAAAAQADAWLERLGLRHVAERFPHLLSRGERQRLALGAILIAGPQRLLLDEPFVGQDAANAERLLALCLEYLAEDPGRSLLVATHDLDALEDSFPTRWRLEGGRMSVETFTAEPIPAAAQAQAPQRVSVGGTR
jgi:energy-coupling factor transport system ATP-binding protein